MGKVWNVVYGYADYWCMLIIYIYLLEAEGLKGLDPSSTFRSYCVKFYAMFHLSNLEV